MLLSYLKLKYYEKRTFCGTVHLNLTKTQNIFQANLNMLKMIRKADICIFNGHSEFIWNFEVLWEKVFVFWFFGLTLKEGGGGDNNFEKL